jgi:hypothetical protein
VRPVSCLIPTMIRPRFRSHKRHHHKIPLIYERRYVPVLISIPKTTNPGRYLVMFLPSVLNVAALTASAFAKSTSTSSSRITISTTSSSKSTSSSTILSVSTSSSKNVFTTSTSTLVSRTTVSSSQIAPSVSSVPATFNSPTRFVTTKIYIGDDAVSASSTVTLSTNGVSSGNPIVSLAASTAPFANSTTSSNRVLGSDTGFIP